MGLKFWSSFALLALSHLPAWAGEWSGKAGLETRLFLQEASQAQQHDFYSSLSFEPEYQHDFEGGAQFAFAAFARLDQHDSQRTHVDLRELYYLAGQGDWEWRIGVRKLFWGVAESQHLVDIVNQTDLVENSDGEDKLGQPMLNLAWLRDWGSVEVLMLPFFRERTFSDDEGRPRTPLVVDDDQTQYESASREHHIDWALRFAYTWNAFDFGLSAFYGTGRDPLFKTGSDASGNPVLIPFYEIIAQGGLDLQYTGENILWKLELIQRLSSSEDYLALSGGFEYTFYGNGGSAIDLGCLVELHHSDQENSVFDEDVFSGCRLAFNDVQSSEILAGVLYDVDEQSLFFNLEASRRIGENFKLELELRSIENTQSSDPIHFNRKDDLLRLELGYFF